VRKRSQLDILITSFQQDDHREVIPRTLREQGFKVKFAGG